MQRPVASSCALFAGVAMIAAGCQGDDGEDAGPCEGVAAAPASYRTEGPALAGRVDGDGRTDRVTLRVDALRPARCRHLLVVELAGGETAAAPISPLPWPGTDPRLLLLAEIDGRPGVEPVVAMSPAAVYRPGRVFRLSRGNLVRLRLAGARAPGLLPFYDEFPAGVDCARPPGRIVVTQSQLHGQDDSRWDVTRSFYRADSGRFELVRRQRFVVPVGPEARERWPEVRNDPFRTCRERVP